MSKVASAPARFVLSPFPPPPRFGWRQHRPLFLQDKQNHRVSSVARWEQLDFDLGLKDEPGRGDSSPHLREAASSCQVEMRPMGPDRLIFFSPEKLGILSFT